MRLSRRAFLAGGAASFAVGAGGYAYAQRPAAVDAPTPLAVEARPIPSLVPGDAGRTRFGGLVFRSGLELRAEAAGFGGISGIWRSADGRDLVALTDNTQWITARVEADGGRLTGLRDCIMAPVLDANGRLLRRTRFYDTEGLAMAGGTAYVSSERHAAILRFDFRAGGVRARGRPVELPAEARGLPSNGGLEALGVAPPGSSLAGALVAVAERSGSGDDAPTQGFILQGGRRQLFQVARSNAYDVTDLAFLPSGEALLLERRFSLFGGLGIRLRRLAADAIRPGAVADGPVVYESEAQHGMDNMEGLCVHREGSQTILTLVSDDNFSRLQRTLLLEFALVA